MVPAVTQRTSWIECAEDRARCNIQIETAARPVINTGLQAGAAVNENVGEKHQ
jgi:hypothetical protein